MRPEDNNPLDLNNLPDDSSRDPRYVSEESSTSSGGSRERESKDGKEYECRFCSLKFCKSQALGGHMNRHRQERETESLNKARELVLRNDSFPAPQATPFCYHPTGMHISETTSYRPMYPPRLFSAASVIPPPPPAQPYYPPPAPTSSPPFRFHHYHSNEYYLGHNGVGLELPLSHSHQTLTYSAAPTGGLPPGPNYTFIGAPIARGHGVVPLTQPRHGK